VKESKRLRDLASYFEQRAEFNATITMRWSQVRQQQNNALILSSREYSDQADAAEKAGR
jgi:hypothetical protein